MSIGRRMQHRATKTKGKVRETWARITGNNRQRGKAKVEQVTGGLRERADGLKDSAGGTAQRLRGRGA